MQSSPTRQFTLPSAPAVRPRPWRPVAVAATWLALPTLALLPALWPTVADAAEQTLPHANCNIGGTYDFQLTVGRTKDAGDVKVCNGVGSDSGGSFAILEVTYEATYPFCLLGTDLHVAIIGPEDDPDVNIPQNGEGSPTPDQFTYFGLPADGCEGEATYDIRIDDEVDFMVEDTVVVAAYAILDENGSEEEAWGRVASLEEAQRFVERGSWAAYFTYEVANTPPVITSKPKFVDDDGMELTEIGEGELLKVQIGAIDDGDDGEIGVEVSFRSVSDPTADPQVSDCGVEGVCAAPEVDEDTYFTKDAEVYDGSNQRSATDWSSDDPIFVTSTD